MMLTNSRFDAGKHSVKGKYSTYQGVLDQVVQRKKLLAHNP